jgi:ubiquinone/menaquinone biosynthesis C-methylase UbiE
MRGDMTVEQMRLGRTEFLAMNNPVRQWLQKHVELRVFRKHLERRGIDLSGKAILDAGCGSGYGSELILEAFRPSRLVAFDLMPEQISIARQRGLDADVFVGNMLDVDLPDRTFDAVFIFGVLHHIPRWRRALEEMARVLKPGAVLLVVEPRVRFNWPEFENGIRSAGFQVLERTGLLLGSFQSYLCRTQCGVNSATRNV